MIGAAWRIDPGLTERFRAAEAQIAWRPAEESPPRPRARAAGRAKVPPAPTARIAHLHDEEARVEEHPEEGGCRIVVDSGPVGALVLLLEVQHRGPPTLLRTREAESGTPFPQGAIEAKWPAARDGAVRYELPPADLVALARYALA